MNRKSFHQLVTIYGGDSLEIIEQKIQKAIEEHPAEKDILLQQMAMFYNIKGKHDPALKTILEAIDCMPADIEDPSEYYMCLYNVCYDLGRFAEAIPALLRALEYDLHGENYMKLAELYVEIKDYKNAIAAIQKAPYTYYEDNDEYSFDDFERYMSCYYSEDNDYGKAVKIFNELLNAAETDEQRAYVLCAFSKMYEHKKNYETSIDNAKQAVKLHPGNFLLIKRLGESYQAAGKSDKAAETFQTLLKIATTDAAKGRKYLLHSYYHLLGKLNIAMDKYDEAAKHFEEDLTIYDDLRDAYYTLEKLSAIYYHQNQYEKMKIHIDKITELWPDSNARAYTSLAGYYLEVEEDYENALNYFLKAAQVNRQSDERPAGIDEMTASMIYANIGLIYHKHLDDDDTAIINFEKSLLLKSEKQNEEVVCSVLYDIYMKRGENETAKKYQDRRRGIDIMKGLFSGEWTPPPEPDLRERLKNPKNSKEEIEKLPYYYKNIPENLEEQIAFEQKLLEGFREDMRNNEEYKEFFSKYNPVFVEKFIDDYTEYKARLIKYANHHYEQEETLSQKMFRKETEELINIILQKKLFNAQLLWRAEKLAIPQVQITYDFHVWESNIMQCPFIEPVNDDDIKLMKRFLADDNFCDETGIWGTWQSYDQLMERDEEGDLYVMPSWYGFYDSNMGTGPLLLLPDIRGEKELKYLEAFHKWKNRQPPAPKPQPAEPQAASLPGIFANDQDKTMFIEKFENDYICKLHQHEMDSRKPVDTEYDDDAVRSAIWELEKADKPVYFEPGIVWHKAIIKAAGKYRNERKAVMLDEVYETYLMKRELNLFEIEDVKHKEWQKNFRNEIAGNIIKGREACGEPGDLNF